MLNPIFSENPIIQELVVAAKSKIKDNIQALLKKYRAKLTDKDKKGLNAAMHLGATGDREACELFIKLGVPAMDCAKGAAYGGHEELARALVNNKSADYPALCVYAAMGGQKETTATLLRRISANKTIDQVRICNQVADAAQKGGHADLVKKYREMAKVREAKKPDAVNDDVSSSSQSDSKNPKSPQDDISVPAISPSYAGAVPEKSASSSQREKPLEMSQAQQVALSSLAQLPPKKTMIRQVNSSTLPRPVGSESRMQTQPLAPQSAQAKSQPPAPQSAQAKPQPPAPQSAQDKPSQTLQKDPKEASESSGAPMLSSGAPLLFSRQSTSLPQRSGYQPPPLESFKAPALHSVVKPAENKTITTPSAGMVPPAAAAAKLGNPASLAKRPRGSDSEEEGAKSPIITQFDAAKKRREYSPVEEGEVVEIVSETSVSRPIKTLPDALARISKLEDEVANLQRRNKMLDIALRNKQREVSELRELYTQPEPVAKMKK